MKLFYSLRAIRPQWDNLMYTLFMLLTYDPLNVCLKSVALMTTTFFELNMKVDSLGYILLS